MKSKVCIQLELDEEETKQLLKFFLQSALEGKPVSVEVQYSEKPENIQEQIWFVLKDKGLRLKQEFPTFYLFEDDEWYYYAPKRRYHKWLTQRRAPSRNAINQWIRTKCKKSYFRELCRKFKPLIEQKKTFNELVAYLEEITPELGYEISRDKRSHKDCSKWIVEHIVYEVKFAVQVKEFEHQKENKVWEHEVDPSLENLAKELREASRDV